MKSEVLDVSDKEIQIAKNAKTIANAKNSPVDYKNCVCVKPWGYEFLAYESDKLGIWYLKIDKGHATSIHTHFRKDTFIIVIDGSAKISLLDGEVKMLNKLDSVFIPRNKFHGLSSYSDSVYLMEIEIFDRSASFSDKNDLLRVDDPYNRSITGYSGSVQVVRDLERLATEFKHFWLSAGVQMNLHGSELSVESLNLKNILANPPEYAILLSGEVYLNGLYCKEGSWLKFKDSDVVNHSESDLVLCIRNRFHQEDSKIVHCFEQLKVLVSSLKEAGRRIVLTSGCYDILHVGHLANLKQAKQHGDTLIVCLSSDAQIKKLKGEDRPINNYADRINLFKTISYVDYIVLYDECNIAREQTLDTIMKIVDPDVWTKGDDYTVDAILAKHPSLKRIVLIPNVQDKSTTNIIRKIKH